MAAADQQARLPGDDRGMLVGIEMYSPSAELARRQLEERGVCPHVVVTDFFDYRSTDTFDVVLGNPPFIRYQSFSGEGRAKGLAAALAQGVRLNRLASAWAAFVIHACSFLKSNGRLGLVLPAELLSVNYAATVRAYLMSRFASLKIVTFEQQVFPGVQEEIVLLLASGSGKTEKFELLQARTLADLEGSLGKRWSHFKPQRSDEKWTNAFIPEEALDLYRSLQMRNSVQRLECWGNAFLGSVTGANDYFLLTESEAHEYQLSQRELICVLPPGSRHLKGIELTTTAWEFLRDQEQKVYLFSPASLRPSEFARQRIEYGERAGKNQRYKCRARTPWWLVPLVEKPDLFITYMTHEGVRLITNNASLHITNSHYGFKFQTSRKALGMKLLPIAALNSLTLLGSEMEGRSYGGGLLKIEPREVERLPLPCLSTIADAASELEALLPQVATSLRREKLEVVCQPVDDVLLHNGMGLSRAEVRELRGARQALFERRLARAKRRK